MSIYLDVIFLENIVVNYLILFVTARFSKIRTSGFRLLTGSLIGALYVVFLVLSPGLRVYYTVAAKFVLSLAIVAVTFWPDKLGTFFKTLAAFYISTFIFAGAAFAFLYLNQQGGFIRNGIFFVFWKTEWKLLLMSILTVGILVRAFWELLQQKFIREKLLIQLKIAFGTKAVHLSALVDTGNSLHDPLTNTPVVVVEFKAIREILPEEIRNIFEEYKEEDLNQAIQIISGSEWFYRFRLIPFTSLGKENGMLIGFKPDYIEIGDEEKKGISDVIIGIYNRNLSKNEKYGALLNPDLVA